MVLIGHGLLVSIGMRPYSSWGVLCYLHRGVQLPFDSSGSRPLGCDRQQEFPLFGVLWIYEWVGQPKFSCLGRGLVEMVLMPFQAVLVSAARDRASSDLGALQEKRLLLTNDFFIYVNICHCHLIKLKINLIT